MGADADVGSRKGVAVASHRRMETREGFVQLAEFEATLALQGLEFATEQGDFPGGFVFVFNWFGLWEKKVAAVEMKTIPEELIESEGNGSKCFADDLLIINYPKRN